MRELCAIKFHLFLSDRLARMGHEPTCSMCDCKLALPRSSVKRRGASFRDNRSNAFSQGPRRCATPMRQIQRVPVSRDMGRASCPYMTTCLSVPAWPPTRPSCLKPGNPLVLVGRSTWGSTYCASTAETHHVSFAFNHLVPLRVSCARRRFCGVAPSGRTRWALQPEKSIRRETFTSQSSSRTHVFLSFD